MFTDRTESGGNLPRRLLAVIAGAALVLAACGGSTSTPSAAAPSTSAAAPSQAGSAPAPSDAGYTGPDATISYSIWGDPAEITSQQAVVDAFHAANPKITVNVTVSDWDTYWDKLQTGIAGGDAPDVFAMDGPLFPDYSLARRPARPEAVHRPERLRPRPAGRRGSQGLHHPGRPVRAAPRPERHRSLLQQGDVRCGQRRRTRTTPGTGRS